MQDSRFDHQHSGHACARTVNRQECMGTTMMHYPGCDDPGDVLDPREAGPLGLLPCLADCLPCPAGDLYGGSLPHTAEELHEQTL